jgi:hypothetical protein
MRASFNAPLAHPAHPAMSAASAYKDQEARHLAGGQVGTSIATRASMSVVEPGDLRGKHSCDCRVRMAGEGLRSIRRSASRLMLGAPIGARLESPGRQFGWSPAVACQPGLGTAPVRTSSAATSRSLVLVCWEAWVRMMNASSSLILCRSIKMPLACSMQARDIIAVRS